MNSDAEREYAWLFRAEFAAVARTAFLITHDRGRAEDIAQDAFVQLLRNWRVVSTYERPVGVEPPPGMGTGIGHNIGDTQPVTGDIASGATRIIWYSAAELVDICTGSHIHR